MLLIFFVLIVMLVAGVLIVWLASNSYGGILSFITALLGFVMALTGFLGSGVYIFCGYSWIASDYQAKIINKEYGTHYTREEVFYASNVIDTIRELDRKRIEINGDLMRDEPKKGGK